MWVVRVKYLDPVTDEKTSRTVYIGIGNDVKPVSHKGEAVVFTKSPTEPYENGYIRAFFQNMKVWKLMDGEESVEELVVEKL